MPPFTFTGGHYHIHLSHRLDKGELQFLSVAYWNATCGFSVYFFLESSDTRLLVCSLVCYPSLGEWCPEGCTISTGMLIILCVRVLCVEDRQPISSHSKYNHLEIAEGLPWQGSQQTLQQPVAWWEDAGRHTATWHTCFITQLLNIKIYTKQSLNISAKKNYEGIFTIPKVALKFKFL